MKNNKKLARQLTGLSSGRKAYDVAYDVHV